MAGLHDVAKEVGLKSDQVVDLFENILGRVANGEPVRIKGFGTFERRLYKGRTLRTPVVSGGEPLKFGDTFVLKFRQSQLAKRRVNLKKPGEKAGPAKKAAPKKASKKAPAKASKKAKKSASK